MRANVVFRASGWAALALGVALVVGACEHEPAPPKADCTPSCEGRCGQTDGCGGTCACEDPPPLANCTDTCESLQQECGEVCGESCGSCADAEFCNEGDCTCKPVCDGTRCDDGCGGACDCAEGNVCDASGACLSPEQCKDTCGSAGLSCGEVCGESCGTCADGQSCLDGTCVAAEGCTDCFMRLHLLERTVVDGRISTVTLAVDFAPLTDQSRPRMADIRIKASKDVELLAAESGPALAKADKSLYTDETTGKAWKRRSDGSYQMLAFGFANTRPFEPGRILTVKFRTSELGPIAFSLVRRDQTLAPPDADAMLQSSSYDQAVVVSR